MGMVYRNACGKNIMIQINQIKLPISHTEEDLRNKIGSLLKLHKHQESMGEITFTYEIIKKSIDARKKPDIYFIYSVLVMLKNGNESKIVKLVNSNSIMLTKAKEYEFFETIKTIKSENCPRPVIVGSGPAGLFCAYLLAEAGMKPIVIEQGECVEKRKESVTKFWDDKSALNPNSNVQFGEGGAGTFSDGKLNTLVKDACGRNKFVLETFVKFGAKQEILFENKPHLGTDELVHIVRNMREYIIEMGGEFLFSTKMTGILTEVGAVTGVRLLDLSKEENISKKQAEYTRMTNCVILAIGHSARDTFYMLRDEKVEMQAKSFAVGLRIEHPQVQINQNQYGIEQPEINPKTCKLPPAEYKLTNQAENGRGVYSFCMCPGGYVVNASSEEKRLAINGMSYSKRDGQNANSALIVSITPDDFGNDDALAGIEFQRRLEEKAYQLGSGSVPIQLYGDFKKSVAGNSTTSELFGEVKPCIKGAYQFAPLHELLPQELNEALVESIEHFGHSIHNFNRPDAVLSGVESRTSSPVRIVRDESGQSNIRGLYPAGEGAGYAGGITSAAMDGMKIAEKILGYLQT